MIEWRAAHPQIRFWEEAPGDYHLDVRELLLSGGEPYPHIMECVRQLDAEERLRVHALFEPKPLVAQAMRMGMHTVCERVGVDHWLCTFSRESPPP